MSGSGRGFEDEARRRVIDAARRSGLSVGDLVQALAENARRPSRGPEPSADADLERRLDDLSERMRRLGGRDLERPVRPTRPEVSNEAALEEIAATVGRLSGGVPTRTTDPAEDEARARIAARRETASLERTPREAETGRTAETARILDMLEGLDRRVRAMGEDRTPRPAAAPEPSATPSTADLAAASPSTTFRARRSPDPAPRPAVAETRSMPIEAPEAMPPRAAAIEPRAPIPPMPVLPEPLTARTEVRATDRETPSITDEALDRRFRELGEKIDLLRRPDERDTSASLIAEIKALRGFVESRGGADVSDEIRRLSGRIDRLADQRPQREVVESLTTEIGRLRDVVLQSNVEGSLRTIEQGYGAIVDRLDDLKRGMVPPRDESRVEEEIAEIRNLLRTVPRVDHLAALEHNLETLADKFEILASREDPHAAAQIERRLADLRTQMDQLDPMRLVVAFDQRLQAVTDKLDALEYSTRVPAAPERVVTLLEELRTIAAGNRTEDQIRTLESRIADLGDRIAEFETTRPSLADTDRLHLRIAEIAAQIERIGQDDDSRRTGAMLEAAIARLDTAIAEASSPRAQALIDARFEELADRIDRRMPPDRTAEVEALTHEIAAMRGELAASRPVEDLEEQMRLLAERIDRSVAQEGDDEALAQIEDQLARISRQIEENQDRFRDISTIEEHILRLADQVESRHLDSVTAAREAARDMVRELADSRGSEDATAKVALDALQKDLRSLQTAARETETRTNDTLISLHDALTGIVGRLAAIEKIAQGSARSAAAARTAAQAAESLAQAAVQPTAAAPAPRPAPTPAQSQPLAPTRVEAPIEVPTRLADTVAEQIATEPRPTIAGRPVPTEAVPRTRDLLSGISLDDNRPLEPGSGKPRVRAAVVAAAPSAGPSESASPSDRKRTAGAASPASRKADFIAAARRAAQAAAAGTEVPAVQPAERPAAEQTEAEATEATAESGALSRIGKVLKNRRRPLVLATAALVLAILTLQVLPGRKSDSAATADAGPAAQTAVAEPKNTETSVAERAPLPAGTTVATVTAPSAADALLNKAPSGAPSVGFSLPIGTDPAAKTMAKVPVASAPATSTPVASAPAAPTTETVPATSEPATTGSIPATASTAAAEPTPAPRAADAGLPEAIGPAALRNAALGGDSRATFEIGLRFAEGRGVAADPVKAIEWYEKAATAGLAQAQYRLGVAYEKGIGTARDSEKARAWYKAAAEQGNVRAMHNLGVSYANGRDMAKAVPWFQKAADLGLRDSQFNLGIIHALGSGVKQDLAVSYKWFALAARQGDQEAEKKQNEIAAHLDKVNLAAARMAVQTWVQRPIDRAANEEPRDWGDPSTAAAAPAASDADLVKQAQQALKAKGFYAGTVDGDAGPGTKAAIRAFQKKAGLTPSGEIDAATIAALSGRAI